MGVQINGTTGNVIATKGTFSGNVGIAGTLTYEDVTDIDAVGLITARSGIEVGASPGVGASISRQGNAIFSGITTIGSKEVGAGITLSPDGNVFASGVTTSTTFVGNLTGNVTGNSDTATTATTATNANHISVADNESTNENNLIPFIEDASATGNVGLESDGDFTYNPSTGTVSATAFSGSGASLTGISAGLFSSYAMVADKQSSGSHGGSFSSGDWRTRTLNTEVFDPDGIVTLSSNQFTLQAGSYFISAMAPAQSVVNHQLRLRNITDSNNALFGHAAYASQSSGNATDDNDYAFLKGRITISGATTYELQHRCNTTRSGAGFGQPTGYAEETYASVEIYKEN